ILLSAGASFIFSCVNTITLIFYNSYIDVIFFEACAMVLTLVTLGKWIEEKAKSRTGDDIDKLSSLVPEYATIIINGEQNRIRTSELKVGDIIIIKSGEHVPVDGEIIDGYATLDKSVITGESLPVELKKGDNITSGCTLVNGVVTVKCLNVGEQTLFEKIIQTVKSASESKAPVQRLADKVAGVFVPIVTALSVIAFIGWILYLGSTSISFTFAVSVLVVSCPCALGLATPVAIMVASGKGASMRVLYKDATTIQAISKVNCVLLDKTSTLTEGKPKIIKFNNYSKIPDKELKQICSALEQNSSHPLATCVLEFCGKSSLETKNYSYSVGEGITATIEGTTYYLGNKNILDNDLKSKADQLDESGYTFLLLSNGKEILCSFHIADELKKDAKKTIEYLKSKKIKVAMITGDNFQVAKRIATQLGGIDFISDVLPQDKLEIVKQYQDKGYKVAFIGDGVNDSPAIKGADVGIAVGNATEIAIDCADVVLLGDKISLLADALGLGKHAFNVIKGNLFWAFFYNVLAIPIAGGLLKGVGIMLTPSISALCMCLSSLFVVTNALRIRNYKSQIKGEGNMKVYIDGMMCKHCEKRVTEVLTALEGVESVSINLKKKLAEINGNPDKDILTQKITEAGYEVIKIKE
ncbi:MAG: cadmium-translocating P-type ATPase, partial [Clostridia bacterium]|nr:cadmium-translocating P-type ATPase [Clostridia bacterium]